MMSILLREEDEFLQLHRRRCSNLVSRKNLTSRNRRRDDSHHNQVLMAPPMLLASHRYVLQHGIILQGF